TPEGAAQRALDASEAAVARPVFFGLRIDAVNEELASQLGLDERNRGVLVRDVVQEGPAARSGVHQFDVILSIGGRELNDPDDVKEIAIHSQPGTPLPIVLLRRASRIELKLVPAR